MSTASIVGLGGRCWIGDIYRDSRNRGHRDVKVQGIPEENWPAAVKLIRCRKRRFLTEEQKAAASARMKHARTYLNPLLYPLESLVDDGLMV